MTWLDLIVLILAVYYLQQVLRWESGPFGVFDLVRERVFGVRIEGSGEDGYSAVPVRPGTLADLAMCIYCVSFWVALIMLGLWFAYPPIAWPFSIAGGVAITWALLRSRGDHGPG